MPARFPSWVCGCAAVPEGLSFPAYATCSALLSALVLVFWGGICGEPGRGRCLHAQPPGLSSLGSATKLESALKMFWGAILSLAFFPCLFAARPFLVPARSSLLPCLCPTQSGATLPLRVCTGPAPGSRGAFRIKWSWKSLSPFSHPLSCFSCSPGLCSRSLSSSGPLCCSLGELAGRTGSLGWHSSPAGRFGPGRCGLPFPGVSIWLF